MIGEVHASPDALARRRARGVLYPELVRAHGERRFPPTLAGLVVWLVAVCAAGGVLSLLAGDLVAELGPWSVLVVIAVGAELRRCNRRRFVCSSQV